MAGIEMNKSRRDELKTWAEEFAHKSSTARRVLELLEDRAACARKAEALAADVEEWRITARRVSDAFRLPATLDNADLLLAAIACLRQLIDATDTPGMPDPYETLLRDRATFLAEQLERTQADLADARAELADSRKFAESLAERVGAQSFLLSRHAEKELRNLATSSN